jgi:hypothetical protein
MRSQERQQFEMMLRALCKDLAAARDEIASELLVSPSVGCAGIHKAVEGGGEGGHGSRGRVAVSERGVIGRSHGAMNTASGSGRTADALLCCRRRHGHVVLLL